MAPLSKPSARKSDFEKDEKALCFHGELLYEAKVLDLRQQEEKNPKSEWEYKVHYKGWKNTWDDWVTQDRLRKMSEENKELAANLKRDLDSQRRESRKSAVSSHKKKSGGADTASLRTSEERGTAQPNSRKRGRDWEIEREEVFIARPSVRIPLPDSLKSLLVDDWENVTKNLQIVPLPHEHSVAAILSDYLQYEAPKRRPGSAEADILEEIVQGVKEYFDKSLGRILLYRFERQQWLEVYDKMTGVKRKSTTGAVHAEGAEEQKLQGKTPSEIYGAEHLCRLFVSMPELIAQTNMDTQSVNRLREELAKVTQWLGKNAQKYFAREYDNTSSDYQELVKGTAIAPGREDSVGTEGKTKGLIPH